MTPARTLRDDQRLARGNLWVVVLAGGEGRRLLEVTGGVPKQFWAPDGQETMLQWALRRALGVVPAERTLVVVAHEHVQWWEREVGAIPRANVLAQPRDCGTVAGILLPLVHILARDPWATLIVLPSDHHVKDERTLARALEHAAAETQWSRASVILLGMSPDGPDTEYGWIVPGESHNGVHAIERFIEKPDAAAAAELLRSRALWSTFIFAARARRLLQAFDLLPAIRDAFVQRLKTPLSQELLDGVYEAIPSRDFSRDVLERAASGGVSLGVVPVAPCGWIDIGTPARLERYLASRGLPFPA